jgi:hypothetical protein
MAVPELKRQMHTMPSDGQYTGTTLAVSLNLIIKCGDGLHVPNLCAERLMSRQWVAGQHVATPMMAVHVYVHLPDQEAGVHFAFTLKEAFSTNNRVSLTLRLRVSGLNTGGSNGTLEQHLMAPLAVNIA